MLNVEKKFNYILNISLEMKTCLKFYLQSQVKICTTVKLSCMSIHNMKKSNFSNYQRGTLFF